MYLHATCCALTSLSLQDGQVQNSRWRRKNRLNPRHKTVKACWEKHGHPASTRAGRVGPNLQKSCAIIHSIYGNVKVLQGMKFRSLKAAKLRNQNHIKKMVFPMATRQPQVEAYQTKGAHPPTQLILQTNPLGNPRSLSVGLSQMAFKNH